MAQKAVKTHSKTGTFANSLNATISILFQDVLLQMLECWEGKVLSEYYSRINLSHQNRHSTFKRFRFVSVSKSDD